MTKITDIDFTPEFRFITSRSSGPGGQNVNKTETKVTLQFDVCASSLLNVPQKEKIRLKLANRIDQDCILQISSILYRSQLKNKEDVIEKFYKLVERALAEHKPRKKTKPGRAAVEKRLQSKKKQSQKKQERRFDTD